MRQGRRTCTIAHVLRLVASQKALLYLTPCNASTLAVKGSNVHGGFYLCAASDEASDARDAGTFWCARRTVASTAESGRKRRGESLNLRIDAASKAILTLLKMRVTYK